MSVLLPGHGGYKGNDVIADLRDEHALSPSETQPAAGARDRFWPVIRVCGGLMAGVGLVVLLGWAFDHPFLASLGAGTIPVAPSTAVLFVLYGVALFLRLSQRGVDRLVGGGMIAAGAVISMLLFIAASQGIHPNAEHLGIAIVDLPGQAPIGHMSQVTAAFFLVAALSYLASLPLASATSCPTLALCLAGLLIVANFLLVLAYLYGTPLFYGGEFIPPAALTCVVFLALGVALLALAAPLARMPWSLIAPTTQASSLFILTFVLLAMGIVYVGFLSFRNYEKRFRAEVETQLSAIAELKGSEIAHWRQERLLDAATLFRNRALSSLVRRFLTDPKDAEAEAVLKAWLDRYRPPASPPYEALFLLDREGRTRLESTGGAGLSNRLTPGQVAGILKRGEVVFQELALNAHDRRISLAIMVPIMDDAAAGRGQGVLILQIDPATYLYPLISRWPVSSRTAETLLIRREGNEVLFLNDQRSGRGTALTLRLSLGHASLPAVQAVLGREGIIEGRDHRGVPVIADLRPVSESPWFIISLIAKEEVFAPLRERLWMMVAFVGVMLLGAAASVGLIWRQQCHLTFRQQLAAGEALRQKSVEIEGRNAEMARFTYTVSHDLKSPLVTIKTFLGYLEQDMAKADQVRIAQDLGYMHAAVDKMRRLLDELLEMSRVGRVVNPPVTCTFREVVDEALQTVAGAISERGVVVEVVDTPLSLHGDRPRLVEVWQNLLENAVKYMGGQGTPRIEIGVQTEGGASAFYVRDNGIGIDPRHQQKVFGLFDKLDPRSEGSGLGLALVKRIVELYDGTIWVESAGAGQGACFWFTVPKALRGEE